MNLLIPFPTCVFAGVVSVRLAVGGWVSELVHMDRHGDAFVRVPSNSPPFFPESLPAGCENAKRQLDSLWARHRWKRPPPDGRPTIHVAGFGFYPTGPAPVDPVKAKAKARWKMVAKFLRPGGGSDAGGPDLQAVSVRRHSSFNLLPVLRVRAVTR